MSDDKSTRYNLESISKLLSECEEDLPWETEVEEMPLRKREKTATSGFAILKRPGSYSYTSPKALSRREKSSPKYQLKRLQRLTPPSKEDIETFDDLDSDLPLKEAWKGGASEVSFTSELDKTPSRNIPMPPQPKFKRASEIKVEMFQRSKTKALDSDMVPTLQAVQNLSDAQIIAHVRRNPFVWKNVSPGDPDLIVFVSRENSRLRVVCREGNIQYKTEAFNNIAEAEDVTLGELYVKLLS